MENQQPLIDLSPVAQTDVTVQPPAEQGVLPTPPVEASAESSGAASGGDREAETDRKGSEDGSSFAGSEGPEDPAAGGAVTFS